MDQRDYIKQLEDQNDDLKSKLAEFQSYHVVTIPRLTNEWVDKDAVMFYAIMTLLERFVEDEWHGELWQQDHKPQTDEEADLIKRQNKDCLELFNIYKWWKNEYPELEKSPGWQFDGYEMETKYALRVVALRKYMWT